MGGFKEGLGWFPSPVFFPLLFALSSLFDLSGCVWCGFCFWVCLICCADLSGFLIFFIFFYFLRWRWWMWVCANGGWSVLLRQWLLVPVVATVVDVLLLSWVSGCWVPRFWFENRWQLAIWLPGTSRGGGLMVVGLRFGSNELRFGSKLTKCFPI